MKTIGMVMETRDGCLVLWKRTVIKESRLQIIMFLVGLMAGGRGSEGMGNDVHSGLMTSQRRFGLEGPCAPNGITAEYCGAKVPGLGQKHGGPIDARETE